MFQAPIRTVTDRHSLPPSSLPCTPMGIPYGLLAADETGGGVRGLHVPLQKYMSG